MLYYDIKLLLAQNGDKLKKILEVFPAQQQDRKS